jgi:rod shape-determining protein MreB
MPAIDIALELGTSFTKIYLLGNGIVLHEPTYAAFLNSVKPRNLRAAGVKAKQLLGKAPLKTIIISPVNEGVIADEDAAAIILKEFLEKITDPAGLLPPKITALMLVPCGLNINERRLLEETAMRAGIGKVTMLESVVASAVGVHMPVRSASCGVIVNIGGGTTEIAVINLGAIVHGCSIGVGGKVMDAAIVSAVLEKHHLQIGLLTAEKLKTEIASLYDNDTAKMKVSGIDIRTKNPSSATVTAADLREAVMPYYQKIASATEQIINVCQPELAADIFKSGICVTGGGSKIPGLEKLYAARLKIPVTVPADAEYTGILGAGELLNDPETLKKLLLQS